MKAESQPARALSIAIAGGGHQIARHECDEEALFVGRLVPAALIGVMPNFMTVITHDGECVITAAAEQFEVDRAKWIPLLGAALKRQHSHDKHPPKGTE